MCASSTDALAEKKKEKKAMGTTGRVRYHRTECWHGAVTSPIDGGGNSFATTRHTSKKTLGHRALLMRLEVPAVAL